MLNLIVFNVRSFYIIFPVTTRIVEKTALIEFVGKEEVVHALKSIFPILNEPLTEMLTHGNLSRLLSSLYDSVKECISVQEKESMEMVLYKCYYIFYFVVTSCHRPWIYVNRRLYLFNHIFFVEHVVFEGLL